MNTRNEHELAGTEIAFIRERKDRRFARLKSKLASGNSFNVYSELPYMFWATDAAGQCIYVNDAFAEFAGATPQGMLAESWTVCLHPDDKSEAIACWFDSVKNKATYRTRYRMRRHDGIYRWMLAQAVAMKDAAGQVTHWVGTNTDIHELVQELQVLENNSIAEQASAAAWAHDIRTPLAVINQKAEVTISQSDSPLSVTKNMHAILRYAERAAGMISDLLNEKSASARKLPKRGKPSLDLVQILSTSLEPLSALYPRRLLVEMNDHAILGPWDKEAIQRAVENLVNNAAKYSYPNTQIRVSLLCRQDRAVLSVHNYGPVLSQEARQVIFQPYSRLSGAGSEKEGWGLGLATVKRVVQEHGGFVEVESSAAEGTTFHMHLPLRIS